MNFSCRRMLSVLPCNDAAVCRLQGMLRAVVLVTRYPILATLTVGLRGGLG